MLQVTATNSNETLGVLILKSRGFFPQAYWYWIGVGALIGYVFLFNSLFALALHCLSRKYIFISCFELRYSPERPNNFVSLNMLPLQHSERIKQAYPKRNCKSEMLQQPKSSFNRKHKRAHLASPLAPEYSY
jgi:hypothetical protein